jgi:ribosome-associated heat shock protein Hsp15
MATAGTGNAAAVVELQRLDKWLWYARISKTRTSAALLVQSGKVRVNRLRAVKASQTVRPGDVLTIALRGKVRVLKVVSAGVRRGPAPEAQALYEPVSTVVNGASDPNIPAGGLRNAGSTRPTKRDRRMMDRFTRSD